MRKSTNIDDVMDTVEQLEARDRGEAAGAAPEGSKSRELIGSVEHYFDKLDVAAIKLTANLAVGDIIEIGDESEAIRQRVDSMQIERKDVPEAKSGDSVGIKTIHPVRQGSDVYRIS